MKIYKRVSIILSFGIMFIGLTTFYITGSMGFVNAGAKEPEVTPTPTPVITATPIPTPEPNLLLEEAYPEVHDLIKRYYDAKLECNKESFRDLVTDISFLDLDEIQAKTSAVTAYTDITCYTKEGFDNIDLVVYVKHYMDIVTIDTPILSLDELYIQYDDTGDPLIFMGNIDSSTQEKLIKLRQDEDVARLINDTQAEINAAIAADEDILAFWKRNLDENADGTENATTEEADPAPVDAPEQ